MPDQDYKPPRISDNYVDGNPYLDTNEDPSTRAKGSSLQRGMEIVGNSVANHEGLSNRI
ncbi:hypothetical protein ABES02_00885 [Neobacillus pocheonensis]|uniref:hypothetical protein n=1 Tax=Neobacillus pocheonensis TaxID=363869 RepID=UPI003D2A84B3